MATLPRAVQSASLTTPDREVWKVEALPCAEGDTIQVTFEDASQRWRQGVWLATDGLLRVQDEESSQFVLWQDTAPLGAAVHVVTTDGLLRFYNVWDSGRGRSQESQAATSGMLRESLPNGYRYRCNDIGGDPEFTCLTFRVTRA